jgi:hypothetical protein
MSSGLCKLVEGYSFDYNRIKEEVNQIYLENNCLSQIGLTHTDRTLTEEEKITESIGSIYNYEDKTYRYKETDFCIFNERYKGTYLYEIYKSIPHIGRFRIMTMTGPSCYTIHKDLTKRYHYVVETNENCLFLFPRNKVQVHIPQDGNLYLLDTRFPHTFVNGSFHKRTHLVFDDISSLLPKTV